MSINHQARKRFGQNFLVDQQIIGQIVSAINPKADDNLVEIGPGMAAITEHLIKLCPAMSVLELDRDLVEFLGEKFVDYEEFTIHSGDALKTDFSQLYDNRELRLVGNLPYNISTPLLFHLLNVRHLIKDMHFMLQKEVVDRLTAEPGNKTWSRMSVMTQIDCTIEHLFDVPPEAFYPPPKVQSAIVRLAPRVERYHPECPRVQLSSLVQQAFSQRRKTLRNNLKGVIDESEIEALGIDPSCRAETLSLDQLVDLALHH